MGAARLRRTSRLRESKDFQRVGHEGVRRASAHFVMLLGQRRPNATVGAPVLGITASRRVGTSVERNRVKRRIREWFRRSQVVLPAGAALVVIARPGAAQLDARQTEGELEGLVR